MKIDNYSKFTSTVLIYGTGKRTPITSEVFINSDEMVEYISTMIGPSLRKSDISKITINVNVHSAKFVVEYIPEIYMSHWQKSTYSMVLKGQLLSSIVQFIDFWKNPEYASERSGKTEIEYLGVMYEN